MAPGVKFAGGFPFVVGRETGGGRELLRIEATARRDWLGRVRSAWMLSDEESGMVHHFGVRGAGMLGEITLTLDYLGEEPPGLVDYSKPW